MDEAADTRVDRLLDAIELIKAERRAEAVQLLRSLVNEHNDFEEAWLWMSVAVESLDLSSLCLDNVLRINPNNAYAAAALHRIREQEMRLHDRRTRISFYRDLSRVTLWLLVLALLYVMMLAYFV
ncbi:MAG: hypothetical protein K8L99_07725 [Anaerolineae bacterium]|nr:hypothetical protein [Anaerolineae bacterium]